jgi:uncharacterized membrane protein YeaQ/YmgE (transglycosylase-associated protein family)
MVKSEVLLQIVGIPWQVLVIFIIIWMLIGLLAGVMTEVVFQFVLGRRLKQLVASAILGIVGAIVGTSVAGWASEKTYNAGAHRRFLWDPNGQLVNRRTFLAENEMLLVVISAVVLVTLWHVVPLLIQKLQQWSADRRRLASPTASGL